MYRSGTWQIGSYLLGLSEASKVSFDCGKPTRFSARLGLYVLLQRPIDSATSVTGYVITTSNYNYKDQPTCQNGPAIKDIWSCFVDIPYIDDPRRGRHRLCAQHAAGQPVVTTSFLVRLQVVGENEQWHGGVAQPAQPPQPPRTAGHLSVGAVAAPKSGNRQRTGFASVRHQTASPSAQGMGQLELPFHALFTSWNKRSIAGTFAPGCVLMLHPLFPWKVPGSESSTPRLSLPGAKSSVPYWQDQVPDFRKILRYS